MRRLGPKLKSGIYNIQCKIFMSSYQDSHFSESIQTWTIGGFNFVLWHHTSSSFPEDGARDQNLVHFKHKYNL